MQEQDNLTLAEEEIVHENDYIHVEIKNPILRAFLYIVCTAGLFSPIILAKFFGA